MAGKAIMETVASSMYLITSLKVVINNIFSELKRDNELQLY